MPLTLGPSPSDGLFVSFVPLCCRTQMLRAALPYIPTHGFSIRSIRAALSSPTLYEPLRRLSSSSSPFVLDQLFPSLPARSPSPLRNPLRSSIRGGGVHVSGTETESERLGPARALFDEWAREGNIKLQKALEQQQQQHGQANGNEKGKRRPSSSVVSDALRTRLEYNIPVLPFLQDVGIGAAFFYPLRTEPLILTRCDSIFA